MLDDVSCIIMEMLVVFLWLDNITFLVFLPNDYIDILQCPIQ